VSLPKPELGLVIDYSYLWLAQAYPTNGHRAESHTGNLGVPEARPCHPRSRFLISKLEQHSKKFFLTKLPIDVLVKIAYASVRGVNKEDGAVQRVLNTRRISSIKDFTLAGGNYPASIVLNWVNKDHTPSQLPDGTLVIPIEPRSAQLIDGQHRVAGLRAALEEAVDTKLEIPVALYNGLTTKDCADIFLAINTEQKPVARTLVFELYGIADESIVDPAAARARDIVIALNEESDSAYFEQIKLPGSPRRRGGIALSTAVTAIKPLVEQKGDFEQRGIFELETQKKIVKNLFTALKEIYADQWDDSKNAFMYASGFAAAVEFLRTKLLSYGQRDNRYTSDVFRSVLMIDKNDLILQEEVKGRGGKEATLAVLERLNTLFSPEAPTPSQIEV
jgi:DNA sulfur modification protein DndB